MFTSFVTVASLVGAALIFPGSLNVAVAQAYERPCPAISAVVTFSHSEDRKGACLGAYYAMAFLEAHGLRLGGPIKINMVPRLIEKTPGNLFAQFDPRDGEAYVLGFSALLSLDARLFGLPMDRDLHQSLAAHEVAHVIANRNFLTEDPPLAAHEYIACVTQLATMPPEHRARILARFPGKRFQTDLEIDSFVFLVSPEYFAVAAYRHFIGSGDGAAVFRRMLTGKIGESPVL